HGGAPTGHGATRRPAVCKRPLSSPEPLEDRLGFFRQGANEIACPSSSREPHTLPGPQRQQARVAASCSLGPQRPGDRVLIGKRQDRRVSAGRHEPVHDSASWPAGEGGSEARIVLTGGQNRLL